MTVVVGSRVPARIGATPVNTDAAFPDVTATYTSPDGAIIVPAGALDRTFAYLNPAGTAVRRDVVVFGDSTTWGANDYAEGNYSWLQRLRDRITAAGLADGGKGIIGGGENSVVYDSPEINGYVSTTFNSFADGFDNLQGGYYADDGSPTGHTVIFQFKGTAFRLWYGARGSAGDFTYTVDGGSATTVHAYETVTQQPKFVYVSGLSDTTHTVVVTNLGGRPAVPPGNPSPGLNGFGSGSLPAGTYYYVATYVYSGGETAQSPVGSVTTGGTRSVAVAFARNGADSAKLYRSTSSSGPFDLVNSTPSVGAEFITFTDDNLTPDTATHPPNTGTTNLNTTSPRCYCAFAGLRETGVALQKHAISGNTMATFINAGTAKPWTAMGLTDPGASDKTLASSYSVDTSLPSGGRVSPILAMLHLGYNDLSGQSSANYSVYSTGVAIFAAMCQAAGCDGIVISGQLPINANWGTYGAGAFATLRDTALAKGLAFVDFWEPIKNDSPGTSPHLHKAHYVAQADYLWDNLLGLTT